MCSFFFFKLYAFFLKPLIAISQPLVAPHSCENHLQECFWNFEKHTWQQQISDGNTYLLALPLLLLHCAVLSSVANIIFTWCVNGRNEKWHKQYPTWQWPPTCLSRCHRPAIQFGVEPWRPLRYPPRWPMVRWWSWTRLSFASIVLLE